MKTKMTMRLRKKRYMRTITSALSTALLVAIVPAGIIGYVYLRYRRALRFAHARATSGSKIAETPCGPIEYAVAGEGPPILVSHGAGGGFDQGLHISKDLVKAGFRVIAMSRFGYLGTPLPPDASAAAQADAHAALLDALNLPHATILGASAGAPSAMQFALRHPERTDALVLLVPAAYAPRDGGGPAMRMPPGIAFLFETALRSDFLFWAAMKLARRTVIRSVLGTPPAVVDATTPDERARIHQLMEMILPVSPRRLGLLNDVKIIGTLPRYELERIAAPALLMSTEDDLYGTFDGARYSAEHIPNARFLGFPSGGHMGVGRTRDVAAEIAAFVRSHAASKAEEEAMPGKLSSA